MTKKTIQTIVFIGAGNVASHLATALKKSGKEILQICSKSGNSAKELAEITGAEYTAGLGNIIPNADLYIISVPDSAVAGIAAELRLGNSFAVHTSGFYSMDFIKEVSKNIGVLYPLQTFSKKRKICFHSVPVCTESNNETNLGLLEELAKSITPDVRHTDSAQRKQIHLAAVFACNFSNLMYSIAGEILEKAGVPFDILQPLIAETSKKITEITAEEAQTGPARRNDTVVITEHIKMLENAGIKNIYEILSRMIIEKYIK